MWIRLLAIIITNDQVFVFKRYLHTAQKYGSSAIFADLCTAGTVSTMLKRQEGDLARLSPATLYFCTFCVDKIVRKLGGGQ